MPSIFSVRLARNAAEGSILMLSRMVFPLDGSSVTSVSKGSQKAGSKLTVRRMSFLGSSPVVRRVTLRTAGMPFCIRA